MKTQPVRLYSLKQRVIKNLAERRVNNTIQNYTSVAENLSPETKKIIEPIVTALAYFGKRNKCHISFDNPKGLTDGNINVTVSKIKVNIDRAPYYYETYNPVMSTAINTKEDPHKIITSIRDKTKEPLKKHNEEQQKLRLKELQYYYETHPYIFPQL